MSIIRLNMYALIKFSNDTYDVRPASTINKSDGDNYIARYQSGRYVANLVAINDNKDILTDIKEKLTNGFPNLQLENISTVGNMHAKVINLYDSFVKNTGYTNARIKNNNLSFSPDKCQSSIIEKEIYHDTKHTDTTLHTTSPIFNNIREDDKLQSHSQSSQKIIDLNMNEVRNDYINATSNDNVSILTTAENDDITCTVVDKTNNISLDIGQFEQSDLENSDEQEMISDKNSDTIDYEPRKSDYSSDDTEISNISNNSVSTSKRNSSSTFHYSSVNTTVNTSFDTSMKFNVPGFSACDDSKMSVELSKGPKGQNKSNCCLFCHKMQKNLVRHLENVHKDNEEVQKFKFLPKGNEERRKFIDVLRKKGNFLYNIDSNLNNGNLITCRRPQKKMKRNATDYTVCVKCKGFFAKSSIRHHFRMCNKKQGTCAKSTLALARKIIGRVHPNACQLLRDNILPVMREDNIVRVIRYDFLIIQYGNKMCKKHAILHQHDMIRAHLRLLGRYLITLKKLNSEISDFASLYDPKFYNTALKAVNIVAGLNEKTNIYRAPSVASSLGTCIKKLGHILESECIKNHDKEKKENVHDFLSLLEEDYGCTVNRIVTESTISKNRDKKVILPLKEDIIKLYNYVVRIRESSYQALQDEFTYKAWLDLTKSTVISIQLFNRRRAGETERLLISDLKKMEKVGESDEQYRTLCPEDKEAATNYRRVIIRGKLNRCVPTLLDSGMRKSLKAIVKFRNNANVSNKNPYVFGIPGYHKNRYKYLRVCMLMRQYSHECGAKRANTLRGTILRKHIATTCASLNLPENKVESFANFMGHHEKIHKQIYRQPVASIDILDMSKVLETGLGMQNENSNHNINHDRVIKNGNQENNKNNLETLHDSNSDIEMNEDFNTSKCKKHSSKNESYINTEQAPIEYTNDDDDLDNFENYTETSKNDDIDTQYDEQHEFTAIKEHDYIKNDKSPKTKNEEKGNICSKKKKRSTSPFGETKRIRWTKEEKTLVHNTFYEHIAKQKLPSLLQIEKFRAQNKCMRSAAVIKTWIHNNIRKNKNLAMKLDDNENTVKEDIKKIFASQISAKTIPSVYECVIAYKSKNLRNFTPTDVQDMILKEIHCN